MNSAGKRRSLETSSSKPGGGLPSRSELAGASTNTTKASNAPAKDHNKRIRVDLRNCPFPKIHVAKIPRIKIVIMRAVGGSERPPMSSGLIKHTICAQREGVCSLDNLICLNKNAPKKGINASGAKCDVMPARQYKVSYKAGACKTEKKTIEEATKKVIQLFQPRIRIRSTSFNIRYSPNTNRVNINAGRIATLYQPKMASARPIKRIFVYRLED